MLETDRESGVGPGEARPRVSVIVPVYNAADTVTDCVDSLLNLRYPQSARELIFVDNGSTDRTEELLAAYGDEITVLAESKRGPAAARNAGIRRARGELVAFVDADCVAEPGWLQAIVSPLEDDRVGVVGGRILARRPCTEIERFSEMLDDHRRAISQKIPSAITMSWASPRSVLEEVGFFDEALRRGEDSDLSLRIFQAGFDFIYQHEAVVYHRNEDTYWKLFREGWHHGYAAVRFHRKHAKWRRRVGARRFYKSTYTRILQSLLAAVRGRNRVHAWCDVVFNVGKKLGKLVGTMRFLYVDL